MAGFFFEMIDNVPAIKASDKFPKYKGSEDHFQKSVARYLDLIGSFWFHCPNGGSRHGLEAAKLKQMGVKSGIPDCLILDSKHGYAGLAIELKVGYNKPSEHQLAVLDKLVERNWMVVVSWSLEEVVAAVDWYYGIGKLQP
jgi:hypothetical protein